MHGKYYNWITVTALVLIVALFGTAFYFVVNFKGSFEAPDVVLMAGGGIGLLALLTGVFYLASQIDTRLAEPSQPEQDKEEWVVSKEY